jgi:hypothetical protein
MRLLTYKTVLLGLALISVVACDSRKSEANRTPGSSVEGTWYDSTTYDSCSYDNPVYNIGEKSINVHKFSKEFKFLDYQKVKTLTQAEVKLKMIVAVAGGQQVFVAKFADVGANLKFVRAETESGEVVPISDSSSDQKMFDLTRCSEPTVYGRLKLATGWYTEYDPNLVRTQITEKDLLKN